MGGGLLQLVAYGAQDVYLTGNPQITFWKVSYRRYTNFSMEAISQDFNGTAQVGGRVSCQISRNGDLIHKMYLDITSTAAAVTNICNGASFALIQYVEVEIGGQRIDRHYGDWMYIWNQLTLPFSKFSGFNQLVKYSTNLAASQQFMLPLEFWFCRNPGLALPLIALQYHEVKVNIQFNPDTSLRTTAGSTAYTIQSATLWVDYIFLDTDERRRMAQNPHEYLIDQLQFTGESALPTSASAAAVTAIRLNFNHPVKELVWVAQPTEAASATRFDTFVGLGESNNLQLNGQDRFSNRNGNYFSLVQNLQSHSNIPMYPPFATGTTTTNSNINVYSFALRPEEHQPSGTCNFSRIDSATLNITYNGTTTNRVRVYAVNYNVLRIMSGMGGLAYSN